MTRPPNLLFRVSVPPRKRFIGRLCKAVSLTLFCGVPLTRAESQQTPDKGCQEAGVLLRAAGLKASALTIETARHCPEIVAEVGPILWRTPPSNWQERERLLDFSENARDSRLISAIREVALDSLRSRADRLSAMLTLANTVNSTIAAVVKRDAEPDDLPVDIADAFDVEPSASSAADRAANIATLERIEASDLDSTLRLWAKLILFRIESRSR